ncbi:MAG TPA: MYG1 family protein [Opitutaceae bacterium]|nr:MYG1 family protein [Opitutaceae bacterium]
MTPFSTILTHPGSAHKDEFLACCVLLAAAGTEARRISIVRREATEADLADSSIAVVDVGLQHVESMNNFDHHQLPDNAEPTCSLSLVLQALGLYADARSFCEWLEPAEWFDCRGPNATAKWLGVDREVINRLYSPIDGTLLRRFATAKQLSAGEPLWEIMFLVGTDLLEYLKGLRARLTFIGQHAQVWTLDEVLGMTGGEGAVLFLPRTDPLPEDPSSGLDRYVQEQGLNERVVAVVSPDRRGRGFGLSRHRDHPRLDFTRIKAETDVHFVHARGFVAKTSATEAGRLKELLKMAAG